MANHCALVELALARSIKAELEESFEVLSSFFGIGETQRFLVLADERLTEAEVEYNDCFPTTPLPHSDEWIEQVSGLEATP